MNRTELPIARPCHADWSTMSLADRGRFCGDCRKIVHELSQLSEREARRLLLAPPSEGLCVRYIYDSRGEIVFRSAARDLVPAGRLVKRAAAVAMAAALPLFAAACMGAAEGRTMGSALPEMGEPPALQPDAGSTVPLEADAGSPLLLQEQPASR